jgi:hypothetical protein
MKRVLLGEPNFFEFEQLRVCDCAYFFGNWPGLAVLGP